MHYHASVNGQVSSLARMGVHTRPHHDRAKNVMSGLYDANDGNEAGAFRKSAVERRASYSTIAVSLFSRTISFFAKARPKSTSSNTDDFNIQRPRSSRRMSSRAGPHVFSRPRKFQVIDDSPNLVDVAIARFLVRNLPQRVLSKEHIAVIWSMDRHFCDRNLTSHADRDLSIAHIVMICSMD